MNWILFSSIFHGIYGFLLENSEQKGTGCQCITVTEYLSDKTRINNEFEQIRHDHTRTLELLAKQLQDKVNVINQTVDENKSLNKTVHELKETNKKLNETNKKLETKYTGLQMKFELLQSQIRSMAFKNETESLGKELESLRKLPNIHNLESLHSLEKSVSNISAQLFSLQSHELSRNQDFIALHNYTVNHINRLDTQNKQTSRQIGNRLDIQNKSLTTEIQTIYKNTSVKIDTLMHLFEQQNATLSNTNRNVAANSVKVALAACASSDITYSLGEIIKFPQISTYTGFNGSSTFVSTGKFKCEVSGMYFISASLTSNTPATGFKIMKNNEILLYGWHAKKTDDNTWNRSATAAIVVNMKINGTLWVKADRTIIVHGSKYSCIAIFKI